MTTIEQERSKNGTDDKKKAGGFASSEKFLVVILLIKVLKQGSNENQILIGKFNTK